MRNGEGHELADGVILSVCVLPIHMPLSPQPAPHSDSVPAKKLRALVFQPAFYVWGIAG